ncbi:MAG: GNAT family N-acetyltransferase [Candidatus Heimdallarchaeota archaeon]|nr:GNAT family N-acetyltransferase [Candidatus Heimdallarchaeota archaeon]MCK4770624.1 GNAT family N-acetyltransferase [Candidatus Heimdallarchaeota archaeon]
MIIKEIKDKEEFKQAGELAELCFHAFTAENMIKFFNHVKDLYFIGAFEENTLLSAAGYHNFQIFIRGQLCKCSGIAAVMTHPIQRKKGHVKQLMIKLLEKSYNDGLEVSALWPFEHGFYRKFGYEVAEKPIFYKIKISNIKDFKTDERISVRESKGKEDFDMLNTISQKALNKNTRIIGKFDAWFLRGIGTKRKIFIFEKEGSSAGFISFKFVKIKDKDWGRNISVLDWAYTDIEIKKSILSFLKKFESDISEVRITLPYEEEMLTYLKEFNTSHVFADWPAMVRVINLKKTLEILNFPKNLEKNLFVEIDDEYISENKGLWNLKISGSKCIATKITNEEIQESQVLKLTINEICQLIVGFCTVNSLIESRNKKIPKEWLDEQLFPTAPCWIGIEF